MEFVLKIILNTQDLTVLQTKTQFQINSIGGRSARFDVLATDSKGKHYNFGIQNANKGAIPQRARFHSAMLDSILLEKNDNYADLPETYVIFFTEKDVLKGNLPIYNVERVITETNQLFGDGEHIIYVNGSYKSSDALGKLIADFHCRDPKKMNFEILSDRSSYLKYQQGELPMTDYLQEFIDKLVNEAKEKARLEAKNDKITFATNFLRTTELSEELIAANTAKNIIYSICFYPFVYVLMFLMISANFPRDF